LKKDIDMVKLWHILGVWWLLVFLCAGEAGSRSNLSSEILLQRSKDIGSVTFEIIGMGTMKMEDGADASFKKLRASDGVGLLAIYRRFDSPSLAKEQFDKRSIRFASVVKRGVKKDELGKTVGERAEVILRLDEHQTIPAILWTNRSSYHEIRSISVPDMLALEKTYDY
jgi:hypothetical protein